MSYKYRPNVSSSADPFRGRHSTDSSGNGTALRSNATVAPTEVPIAAASSSLASNTSSSQWARIATDSGSMGSRGQIVLTSGSSGKWAEASNEQQCSPGKVVSSHTQPNIGGQKLKCQLGDKSLEWVEEVLARGPQQDVACDESEAILWKAVEEYCVKRRREQGSPENQVHVHASKPIRSQSVTISGPHSDAMECKKLSMEVDFLQNEVKRQRDRCTELEAKLRSVSPASQACTVCDLFRTQLAAKESALAERDSRLALMTTRLQKSGRVSQNTAMVVSESKQMASQRGDLDQNDLALRNGEHVELIRRNDQSKQELQDRLGAYEAQLKQYENDFKQERKKRVELEIKLISSEDQFKARESSLRTDLQEKDRTYGELRRRYTEMERRCTDLERSHGVMNEQWRAAQGELQTKNQQVKQYKTQVERCREQLATCEMLLQQQPQQQRGYRV